MTLDDACRLATEIEAGNRGRVVAIGRFVELVHLDTATRWGVSVLVSGSPSGKPVVIWEREGWSKLSGADTGPRRDEKYRDQLSLF